MIYYLIVIIPFIYCSLFPYEQFIELQAHMWAKDCQNELQENGTTIVQIIELSKQISILSCLINSAKNRIQQEVLKIYTPSLSDTWQQNLQAIQNDVSAIMLQLECIQDYQTKLERIICQLKDLVPIIIQQNPLPIQHFIADLKISLLFWIKQQEPFQTELKNITIEFEEALHAIVHIKSLLTSIFQEESLKNHHLKEAAGSLSKTHHNIDFVIEHIAKTRLNMLERLQQFFIVFFNTYERILEKEVRCYSE